MLDYKRFISYLYAYVEGEKGVNVGYIRCDQRQGKCRFVLNLQDRQGIEGGKYKVYLYRMEEETIPVGYYLDEFSLHKNCGELRKQTMSENVWNTSRRIDEFDGIIAIYDRNHIYASQWSELPLDVRRFLTYADWQKQKEQTPEIQIIHRQVSEPQLTEVQTVGMQTTEPQLTEVQTIGMQTTEPQLTEVQTVGMQTTEPQLTEVQTIGMQTTEPQLTEVQTIGMQTTEPQLTETQTVGMQTTESQLTESQPDRLQAAGGSLFGVDEAEEIVKITETKEKERNNNQKSISELTLRLMENRAKLPDFENHEIYDCVRIEPNDIGLLEMENWRLGVNSFLTHGYYNYKYLMIGKLRFQDGVVKAVLGVPGVFNNKEQYIAKIFGFDLFVPVKHTNIRTGNFGYWIVELV